MPLRLQCKYLHPLVKYFEKHLVETSRLPIDLKIGKVEMPIRPDGGIDLVKK